MLDAARDCGYLQNIPPIRDEREVELMPRHKALLLCTGSQGEARSALMRIAGGQHQRVRLEAGDTVIFSAKIIPGNERTLYGLHNLLVRQGIEVVTEGDHFVHVSGHPCRDELEQMYRWIKPKIAVPVHGEARHLHAHQRLAQQMGVPHALLIENGDMLRLAPGRAQGDRRGPGRLHGGRDRRSGRHRRRHLPHPPPADEPRHDPGEPGARRPWQRAGGAAAHAARCLRARAVRRAARGRLRGRHRRGRGALGRRGADDERVRDAVRAAIRQALDLPRQRRPIVEVQITRLGADTLAAFEPMEEAVP